MTRLVGVVLLAMLVGEPAAAQDSAARSLKDVPAAQQVTRIAYCRGHYDVALADGSTRTFREYDLAFKTDTSPNGPAARPSWSRPDASETARSSFSRISRICVAR